MVRKISTALPPRMTAPPSSATRTEKTALPPLLEKRGTGVDAVVARKLVKTSGQRYAAVPLSKAESQGISADLADITRGMDAYAHLPQHLRDGMSQREFAVAFAMMEAMRSKRRGG